MIIDHLPIHNHQRHSVGNISAASGLIFFNQTLEVGSWPAWTDFRCHADICPGKICPGDICSDREYLSYCWPNFDKTIGLKTHLEPKVSFEPKKFLTQSDQTKFFVEYIFLETVFLPRMFFWTKILVDWDIFLTNFSSTSLDQLISSSKPI